MVTISGCNMGVGIGSYEFKKVHIDTHNHERCLTIEKWYDSETGGIEVKTREAGSLFLSEGTYLLVGDSCPLCDQPTEDGGAE